MYCPSYIFGTERWSDFILAGLPHELSPTPPSMHGNGATCPGFEFLSLSTPRVIHPDTPVLCSSGPKNQHFQAKI